MAEKYDWAEAQMAVFQKIEGTKEALNKLETRQDAMMEKLEARMREQHEKLQNQIKELAEKVDKNYSEHHTDLVTLKIKSGLLGLLAGALPGSVYVIWELITGRAGK